MSSVASSSQMLVMRGDYYNNQSTIQRQVLNLALPYIKMGIEAHNANLPESGPLIIADLFSSTAAMPVIIENLRKKYGLERTKSIIAVHEDLPLNNYSALFGYAMEGYASSLKGHEGIVTLAAGKNFYRQILPNKCLQFAFSNVALHWLSNLPTKIANHCIPSRGSPAERELFKRQAAKDWQNFLTVRSGELVTGGVIVVYIMSDGEPEMDYICDALYAAILRLRGDGIMTDQEVLDFNLRIYRRSMDDVRDASLFDSLGLEIIIAEKLSPMPNFLYTAYSQHRDAGKLAQDIVSSMTAVFEPSFLQALSPWRSVNERKAICAKLWPLFTEEMARIDPEKVSRMGGNIFVVIRKK